MKKIYLILYNKDKKFQFIKYFDTIKEKDRFKIKIKHCKNFIIIEDSEDIIYV